MQNRHGTGNFQRGEVWLVDFGDTKGHEQRGVRPAVIFGTNYNVQAVGQAIVIPGTTTVKVDPKTQKLLPDVVEVSPTNINGLSKPTYFLCSQVRSVSITRFEKYLGRIALHDILMLSDIMKILFNFD